MLAHISIFMDKTIWECDLYVVSLWNMLDDDLRNATTVKALEKALKLVMNE